MTSILDVVEDYCNLRQFHYHRLDGSTRMDDRRQQVTHSSSRGNEGDREGDWAPRKGWRQGGTGIQGRETGLQGREIDRDGGCTQEREVNREGDWTPRKGSRQGGRLDSKEGK